MINRIGHLALFVALLGALLPILGGCSQSRDLPNIILISMDTVRADHLSCYGYEKQTTPMIDLLAQKGVKFTRAYAPAPWTLPSHASMFTGLYPSKHKAIDERISIDKEIPLLTEKLKSIGYKTGGFVSHYYLSKDYGFDRGFDKFVMKLDAPAWEMTELAGRWIRDSRKKSFFAFIHYFDPHTPYRPPMDFAKKYYPKDLAAISGDTRDVLSVIHTKDKEKRENMIKGLTALYDGEIDYVDSALGELYKKLQLYKLDQNTLIIITSDHGEEFYEHGLMEHGFTLYEEQLHVPLIMYCPDKLPQNKTVDYPVSLVDLMPTIMQYAGMPSPKGIDGLSFLPLAEDKSETTTIPPQLQNRVLHAQTTRQGPDRMCVIDTDHKFIYSPEFRLSFKEFGREFYDLQKDRAEKSNLFESENALAEQYEKQMMDSGMYVPKKVWRMLFSETDKETRFNGRVSTMNRIIYAYKDNVIYDTDLDRKLVSREFPWQKRDSMIRFVGFGQDGQNGFAFVTDPPDAKVNWFLFVNTDAVTEKVAIGSLDNHPKSIPFSLEGDIKREAKNPPEGGYLVWSETEYVNKNVLLRFEVGDQIQPSAEMRERLRTLGYLSGDSSTAGHQ